MNKLEHGPIESVGVTFQGEYSYEEVNRVVDVLHEEPSPVDCLVAVDGDTCVDAMKRAQVNDALD